MANNAAVQKPLTKSETLSAIADQSGVVKRDVAAVLDALGVVISRQVGKKGPGQFTLPGLLKITILSKPATKATTKPNPFKPGEMMAVKAKPARRIVKVRPLKNLKEMA